MKREWLRDYSWEFVTARLCPPPAAQRSARWFLPKAWRATNNFYMILSPGQSQEIVDRLRRDLDPEEILLFGSQACGRAEVESSDVDLCVVVADDDEPVYEKTVRAYRSLRGMGFPKDIIVRHRSRFAERSHWRSSVEREIAEHATPLFRR